MSKFYEAEDAYNRDLRITKAIERAAVTIAAAILKSADGHASSEWTHADVNVFGNYPLWIRSLRSGRIGAFSRSQRHANRTAQVFVLRVDSPGGGTSVKRLGDCCFRRTGRSWIYSWGLGRA